MKIAKEPQEFATVESMNQASLHSIDTTNIEKSDGVADE
jgi:hypothetical protein